MLLFCAATAAYAAGSVFVFEKGLLQPAVTATNGLVSAMLMCSAVALVGIGGGILLGVGRLGAHDVGLRAANVPIGLAVTLALWVLLQVSELLMGLIGRGGIAFHHDWATSGAPWVAGGLIGQLFGNALFEEIAYRGFLLPQLYLKLKAVRPGSRTACFVAALVVSQSVFALMHIPIRLHQGTALDALPANLLATVFVGLFFCWIYLQTGNLFVAVGVHALINKPTPVLEPALSAQFVLFVFVVVMLLLWPRLARPGARASSTEGLSGRD